MVLPLYLAMTAAEISGSHQLSEHCAYMACHFSPYSEGLTNIPRWLPPKAMLILNDRMPCDGHSADLVAAQLLEALTQLDCESVLLDFQRTPEPESIAMVEKILSSLPCPVAVTEDFAQTFPCPVFLSPSPLHIPLEVHTAPWKGREIWLEAALCQEEITVTETGSQYVPIFPTQLLSGGFYEEALLCHYSTSLSEDSIRFNLFDTPESFEKKLDLAQALGISRAVGLWQEFKTFPLGKPPA